MRLNITYVKSKMTYITGMCPRKSFNLLRGLGKGVGCTYIISAHGFFTCVT